jgi:hypothetical protein
MIGVMALRRKHQVTREIGIAIQGPDALQYITKIKLKGVTCDGQVLAFEWRAPGELLVDNVIQFVWRAI